MSVQENATFPLCNGTQPVSYYIGEEEYEGVSRILKLHTEDFEAVTGFRPNVYHLTNTASGTSAGEAVIVGTLGKSELLKYIAAAVPGIFDGISGKREVFLTKVLDGVIPGFQRVLLIAGSDKRGTIYGIFRLSELIGVSPFIWWADAAPRKNPAPKLSVSILNHCSKEPSVRYRGFFINDEWPSFGSWTMGQFGGFNASMYERVFQLLLRLKGNYLWPAMWSSSFSCDGPGLASAELADMYGIVMGASHHEPCSRASEEWDAVRGKDTVYGNEWNFYKNRDGLLRYWEGGLKRNKNLESMITIGMRGERDTSMLGPDATLRQNIDLLKDIITEQNRLIRTYVNPELSKVPRLLALYKEVEAYYYGDDDTEGLIDFPELDGVTIMLCEDNYGNLRTLPPKNLRNRNGGFGMYYHFDYHGGPISYEWVNSSPLAKTWEQMSMAYDYGIRDVWIVNVGDLKPQELPLSFFMDLAYDFDTYGTSAPNSTREYTRHWAEQQFPNSSEQLDGITRILTEYTDINGMRRPEAMNPEVYSANKGNDACRMLARADEVIRLADQCLPLISNEDRSAFIELVYFPAVASMNVQRMSLLSALNRRYATEHRSVSAQYETAVTDCIALDKNLTEQYNCLADGKWRGMMSSAHICFETWNDERWSYPVSCHCTPISGAKLLVYTQTPDGYPKQIRAHEIVELVLTLDSNGITAVKGSEFRRIDIANGGTDPFDYTIISEYPFLCLSNTSGTVTDQDTVSFSVDTSLLFEQYRSGKYSAEAEKAIDFAGNTCLQLELPLIIQGAGSTCMLSVPVRICRLSEPVSGAVLLTGGTAVIGAADYTASYSSPEGASFVLLREYGFTGTTAKVYPTLLNFDESAAAPGLEYSVFVYEGGTYQLTFLFSPSNHLTKEVRLRFAFRVNEENPVVLDSLPEGFLAGAHYNRPWCKNVLDNYRELQYDVRLKPGLNRLLLSAVDAGLLFQQITVIKENNH